MATRRKPRNTARSGPPTVPEAAPVEADAPEAPEVSAAAGPVTLKLTGRVIASREPSWLKSTTRSAEGERDPFFPAGYLTPVLNMDVGIATRGSDNGASEQTHETQDDEVIVLELADGSVFVTSAERLRASLAQTHPELLGPGGEILLEELRQEGVASRGWASEAVGGLISKVFSFVVGRNGKDEIIKDAVKALGGNGKGLGISWLGTKALMAAIEGRLPQKPGLYRWSGAAVLEDFDRSKDWPPKTVAEKNPPILVFVHGTASSTLGSFGELREGDRALWAALEATYTGGIFALEHRTLSESPIDNAIDLVKALPDGARVSLVSHSRGGLVADLLCLRGFEAEIDRYENVFEGTGSAALPKDPQVNVKHELGTAHAEHRKQLAVLAKLLSQRQIVVERYVRTASPANGTRLASGNFDLFLSGILTLIGQVPVFFGSPLYSAFKRVAIEIAKNRTDPHLVPGIEAMLPDSPMARLLRDAPVQSDIRMAVIAGDIEGGNLLKRLGVLLTDFLLFDRYDNDLVVDTSAMLAGVAHRVGARVLFDRGADVSHFRYFTNADTRSALRDWLVTPVLKLNALDAFRELPDPQRLEAELADALKQAASRDATEADRPVVVLLPGVMGSHLSVAAKADARRVWFDPVAIAAGKIVDIDWGQTGVEADEVFGMSYGQACKHLVKSHHVECFAYDWRQPLDVLGERLGAYLERLMAQTDQPIRLLAHSMGGLVVRACIHRRRAVMDRLMARDGARLVMLGTPHQGAHSMVENLLGKGDTLRMLVRLDLRHDMQEVLDIVARFRGALQLLPKPKFIDDFQGQDGGGGTHEYQLEKTWAGFKADVRDLWFGNGKSAVPEQAALDAASWLWEQDGPERPKLPDAYTQKSIYVFGIARQTPCGLRNEGGRLRMVATPRGDGTVTWESGRIGGVGSHFYMAAEHGDLLATREHFDALVELLSTGGTGRLPTSPPAVRAIEQAVPVSYDAGPPVVGDIDATARAVMGASLRRRVEPRAKRRLEVSVKAMDLRFLSQPMLVGHYEQDPIAGPQALIDSELLDGDLTERHNLGLYAGPVGTAVVVLRMPNEAERRRGSLSGAVVTGLGPYDGALGMDQLTEAVRTGVLRYLLQVVDVLGKADREVPLATLLVGYNSSANLTVAASVEALVCGVYQANARFKEATRLNIRVGRLSIVELYLDTAITAVYCLRQMAERLCKLAEKQDTHLVCSSELEQGEGFRPRLLDMRAGSYWPRLILTNPDDDATLHPAGLPAGGVVVPGGATTALATRIKFLYVGQRARAESIVQQRQPGLVERLVRQQIANPVWQEDFGRTLFQLMVPHDFKDAARQLSRIVLVVDPTTANLPWELMLADDPRRKDDDLRPLALRTPVVRQLASKAFRRQVRQSLDRTALVVGNPALTGFDRAFPRADGTPSTMPPDLPGAQAEAEAVTGVLSGMGYEVMSVIGNDQPATNVLAALYRRPWRVLHVSAHGVFNLKHADGLPRSGVLLSDGLLLSAAEIEAMESVPELVFLSCCHLGKVDLPDPGHAERLGEANKLAASVARGLIEIGVRCVVVAGWAVSDDLAQIFGETFYEELLRRRQSFGDAVFRARLAVWDKSKTDITWGAYQAYGDPGWKAEARVNDGDGYSEGGFVSYEELLDRLASARADFSRQADRLTEREKADRVKAIDEMIEKRCPPGWLAMPLLQSALAATWRDLGKFEPARTAFIAAIQAEDKFGRVPIRDIEQLANVEARLGETQATAAVEKRLRARANGEWSLALRKEDAAALKAAKALIDLALQRIDGLDTLVSAQVESGDVPDSGPATTLFQAERCAIRGSAWKRIGTLHAQDALTLPKADRAGIEAAARKMQSALEQSIAAYRQGEGLAGSSRFMPYQALNRLALQALVLARRAPERDAGVSLARQCGAEAALRFANVPTAWDALMQPEAQLVELLLDGRLGEAGDAGRQAFDALQSAYVEALRSISLRPSQLDSVLTHMELLSRFLDAISLFPGTPAKAERAAARLLALARSLSPARPLRTDRPQRS